MVALPETVRLTYEDLRSFPEDGRKHELLDGEHCVTPAPVPRHQRVLLRLASRLEHWLEENPLGLLFTAPCDVVLSDFDVVQPDLLFISRERQEILTETHVAGAPDLVAEILSESTRKVDLVVKRKLYGRFGVREYWAVDPVVETVQIFRRQGAELQKVGELAAEDDESLATPLLPGFELPLRTLFG